MTNSSVLDDSESGVLQSSHDIRHWLRGRQTNMLDSFLHSLQNQTTRKTDRLEIVKQTVNLCRHFIGSTQWTTPAELLLLLRGIGDEIRSVYGDTDPALYNILRRILAAVREETSRQDNDRPKEDLASLLLWTLPQNVSSRQYPRALTASDRHTSMASESEITTATTTVFPDSYYTPNQRHLKEAILEAVQEIYNELVDMRSAVAEMVSQQIHTGDVVLVCGAGRTLASFLAAAPASTTLLICGSPALLAELGPTIPATVVSIDVSHAVAVRSRVHTTLVSAHAVLADGGVVGLAGAALVAASAEHRHTLCITGMDALCPEYPHEANDTLQNWIASPDDAVDIQPVYDYIPPEHINLFVTNVGSFPPSFIYRLLAENYHSDDWKLFRS